jgi:uncharacterized protein YciI
MTRTFLLAAVLAAAEAAETNYTVAFPRKPPNAAPLETARRNELQAKHMAHIRAMFEKGALVGAGPIIGGAPMRGVFIFRTATPQEAAALSQAGPYVRANQLAADFHVWRGLDGISEEYKAAKRANPEAPDRMIDLQLALLRGGYTEAVFDALRRSGKLLACGPVLESGAYSGICVLDAGSADGAKALLPPGADAGVYAWMVGDGVIPRPNKP